MRYPDDLFFKIPLIKNTPEYLRYLPSLHGKISVGAVPIHTVNYYLRDPPGCKKCRIPVHKMGNIGGLVPDCQLSGKMNPCCALTVPFGRPISFRIRLVSMNREKKPVSGSPFLGAGIGFSTGHREFKKRYREDCCAVSISPQSPSPD